MDIVIESRAKWLLAVALLPVAAYLALITQEFLAFYLANRGDLAGLHAAVKLEPGNADYHHILGRYSALIERAPLVAVEQYRTAVRLNPYVARYWLDLAAAYQLQDDVTKQADALEHATAFDPTSPQVAWEAANLYLVRGQTEKALRQFRLLLQNDPSYSSAALHLCWRATPDVDALLQQVVPPRVEPLLAFLDLLASKKETAGTLKAWSALMQLHQPFEVRHVFEYIKYLILQHDVEHAQMVWQQAAGILGFLAYLPSPNNLIVNGDFSLDVLNGGFDWNYQRQSSVALALDLSNYHASHRSLSIVFDGPGVSDAGIYQLIPVQPNTSYQFTAYFKAEEVKGVGGPHFTIRDSYTESKYFESDDLKNAEFWKPVSGRFTTGSETRLLVLRVERVPAGSPLRGKLWIDDLHLTQTQPS